MIFAAAGFKVKIYDIKKDQIEAALEDIASQLKTLEKNGLIRDRDRRIVGRPSSGLGRAVRAGRGSHD